MAWAVPCSALEVPCSQQLHVPVHQEAASEQEGELGRAVSMVLVVASLSHRQVLEAFALLVSVAQKPLPLAVVLPRVGHLQE